MRVAIISNMWPTLSRPWHGVFVARLAEALRGLPAMEVFVRVAYTTESRLRYATEVPAMQRWLRDVQPDVVHYQYGLSQLLAPAWRGPSVVTFHGSDLEVPRERILSTLSLSLAPHRAVVVVRETLARHLPQRLLSKRLVVTVPCGVDTTVFYERERSAARRLLGVPQNGTALLFPSSPARAEKNHPLFERVRRRVEELVDEPVTEMLLDQVAPEHAAVRFAAADAVVLTSVREGSPIVVKEALACRRPVVCTPVGDVMSYTGGAFPCAVASGWDPDELARLVCEALRVRSFPTETPHVPSVSAEASDIHRLYKLVAGAKPG